MELRDLLPGARRITLRARSLAEAMRRGGHRAAFRGRGLEFEEVREYAWGDDPRAVDWNVSARLGRLQVKRWREERELDILLVLDTSASMRGGAGGPSRMGTAAAAAALLALAAEANGDLVGAVLFGGGAREIVPARRGARHALALVARFLGAEARGRGSDLAGALRAARMLARRRCVCVLVSDFLAAGWEDELAALGARNETVAMLVRSPTERAFPPTGLVELEDPETGARLLARGRSRRFIGAWETWAADRVARVRAACAARGVGFLALPEGDPAEAMIAYFRARRSPA